MVMMALALAAALAGMSVSPGQQMMFSHGALTFVQTT
jgi:hypothetical protein